MMKDIRVLILSGGKGTRLQTVVSDRPKPMADIAGKPFLDYLVQKLKSTGFTKISLLTGYKSEVIEDYFKSEEVVSIIKEKTALGTGGCIRNALETVTEEKLLILNGDTYCTVDLEDFVSKANGKDSIVLQFMNKCDRYGTVELAEDNKIISFKEKDPTIVDSYINAGIYFLDRKTILDNIPMDKFVSLESEVFPAVNLHGVKYQENFIDIGIPDDYNAAQDLIPQWINNG
jgi:NDP-sugar pyrophosphorylase family protein